MADLEEIAARLDAISEELGDIAMDRLREALASGDEAPAKEEKLITRARRSIDKASNLLRPAGGSSAEADDF